MLATKWILHIFIVTLVLMVTLCEARGGRRGGSMGGIFGSWRKYKKPSTSGGSSRRIVSSSPVHTPITKALNEKKAADKFGKNGKQFNSKYNTPPLPAGGSYYANTNALPANAVYVAQAPPRGADFGDFLTGYLTGRLLTMGMTPYYPPHQYVTHVYPQNPNQQSEDNKNGSKVIIVNNNQQPVDVAPAASTPTASRLTTDPLDYTTETDKSSTMSSTYVSSSTTSSSSAASSSSSTVVAPADPPPYGIICMPMMVNEASASGVVAPVERIVCYPAPPPSTPIQSEMKSKPVEIAGDIIEH